VLVKPVSARCNLACRYCFYRDRATDPYPAGTARVMPRETLAALIAQHMRLPGPAAVFGWQGGEPTLAGLDFFRQVVNYQQRYGASGQIVANALQTNGVALDADWARFLARYRFLVGVSLDGPAEVHDRWRPAASGAPTYERVMAALAVLKRYRVETNVLAVVHAANWDRPEGTLAFFYEQGLRHLQFVPAVDRLPDGSLAEHSLPPEAYGEFLCRLFDAWYQDGHPEISIRYFDNLVGIAAGQGNEMCELGARCDTYYVVEHNGDVYPCDFFVDEPRRLGNLVRQPITEILGGPRRRAFADARQVIEDECRTCQWLPMCHGGCLRYRYVSSGSLTGPNWMCRATVTFLEHAWGRIQALATTLSMSHTPSA
jgi:uncharacterized protein